jgi:hypothetical protein
MNMDFSIGVNPKRGLPAPGAPFRTPGSFCAKLVVAATNMTNTTAKRTCPIHLKLAFFMSVVSHSKIDLSCCAPLTCGVREN